MKSLLHFVIGAFVETPEAFGFFRLTTGFSVSGLYLMSFIMTVEIVGAKFAAFFGIATSIAFALGELILGLEAYFIRDWRTLQVKQLACSAPSTPAFLSRKY